jgi:DNA-binding transcriptional LysR family regulator
MGRSKVVGALPRLPIEVLRYVVLIADQGSTVAAAQTVNMTSSSLSRKIGQLEHELGVALFERHSRGMRVTEAGELVLTAARQMLARMDRLANEIDDFTSPGGGLVRVQASQALVEHIIMPRILEMGQQNPNLKVDLTVAAGRQAERALIEDTADFALIITVPRHPDIEIAAERGNRVVAIVNRQHTLAERQVISAADVAKAPFAALSPVYSSRLAFNSLLPTALKDVQPHFTSNSVIGLKAYALSGLGPAIVPELTVWGSEMSELSVLELEGSEKTDTRMCLCRRRSRNLSAAAEKMFSVMADALLDPMGQTWQSHA